MRRFSQRNSLVTLSDINITPLLDLAFVLLIIFVIISPSIRSAQEQSIKMQLPKGGQPDQKIDPKNIVTVEASPQGFYALNGKRLTLQQVEAELLRASRANPDLIVYLRADKNAIYDYPFAILDLCQNHRISCSLQAEPKE